MQLKIISLLIFSFLALLPACSDRLAPAPSALGVLAAPIAELTPAQMAVHIRGDEEFAKTFGVEDGLGPVFNEPGCEFCHIGDGKGHPLTALSRFGRYDDANNWDMMLAFGGPQLQDRAIPGADPEVVPARANGFTTLIPPNVTGLGYLEAVSDATLLQLADPDDANGDGISGRVHWRVPPDFFEPTPHHMVTTVSMQGVTDGVVRYIARFGRKATTLDLLHQTVVAYVSDIGITSDFAPHDPMTPSGVGARVADAVPDPEIGSNTILDVAFYLRTLQVPPRRDSNDSEVQAGEILFEQIGCAACHIPTLTTGPSDVAALANRIIHPYTDMLLHDMGPELDDNYQDGEELSSEWRTTPLWGLGLQADSQGGRTFYLHDGRATTLAEAIEGHGGEATDARTAYRGLSAVEKTQLYAFLESL